MHEIYLSPGINKIVIDHLKEQGSHVSEEEKICFLVWDEVSTESQLHYDTNQNRIIEYDPGVIGEQTFMLREMKKNWVLPLTYNFCKSSTSANQLKCCIQELVKAVTKCGFKIVATVCNQGSTNVSCINSLLNDTRIKCFREKIPFCQYLNLYFNIY